MHCTRYPMVQKIARVHALVKKRQLTLLYLWIIKLYVFVLFYVDIDRLGYVARVFNLPCSQIPLTYSHALLLNEVILPTIGQHRVSLSEMLPFSFCARLSVVLI